jgi:thioredoxin reductase (NADPH)
MKNNEIYDLIIIGGGPGGLTAGIYAMRAALNTVLLEKGVQGGQVNNTDIVENWPGRESVSGADLAMQFSRHAESYGLESMNQEVKSVVPGIDFHSVRLEDGDVLKTYAVILATGGNPRKLNIPGETEYYGKGVSYCAVCDGFFFKDKVVMVVGGGDSALVEALYLAKLARKVYIAHRRNEFRAGMILQERVRAEKKIEVLWNTVLISIGADETGVNGVEIQDTNTEEKRNPAVDGVFIFIGFDPNNQLVPASIKMNAEGHVVTDEKCATSLPGIFAVGDLREKYARQIVTAAADGATAALAAAHYVEEKKG